MLFNSPAFLFVFLPVVLAGCSWLRRRHGHRALIVWLCVASLVFYGVSNPRHLPLLLASLLANHHIGLSILSASGRARKMWLWSGVAGNLVLLGLFKYSSFLAHTLSFPDPGLVLPVGISFFTFTQIAYLVDAYRRQAAPYGLASYTLFVSYFPHLVAGPILHHRPTILQFESRRFGRFDPVDCSRGAVLFAIGLAKKVLIADQLAPFADACFAAADAGFHLNLWESWLGLSAYALQLYFDFSGYSDMAVGLSMILGVRIPINFQSPYRATSIIDFWRRWHISLSIFLRDYLYIPLGGNRFGPWRRSFNLMVTMLLGGLWHGAGWGFVVWGGLHGLYLLANHAWRHTAPTALREHRALSVPAWILTTACVLLAWAFFRASTLDGAWLIWRGALGLHGVGLPQSLGGLAGVLQAIAPMVGWTSAGMLPNDVVENKVGWVAWITVASIVALLPRNSNQLAGVDDDMGGPSLRVAMFAGLLFGLAITSLHRHSPFLYFQF